MTDHPDPPSFEDLLAECAERLDREGGRALDEVCARHPDQSEALRRAMAPLLAFGVVGPAAAPPVPLAAIGPLQVERKLGEGAFGVVYLCRQTTPIERQVAVKVLRPGAGSSQTLARFDAERQVLARMNHPAIANVIDAGAMPDGRPYFVMEYVDGAPITTYCDQHRLPVGDRLALFLLLCDGVQYAHGKGIIHRDLKPSNALVRELSGTAQPKIIDFGLAKVMHQPLSTGPHLTEAGHALGTPGFMSPEQAEGRHDDVDTRTDVFALGVILYVLLAGEMPWPKGTSTAAVTAARPSTRVPREGEQASRVAAARQTEPRRLQSQLRGDLDWIVLRALDPDQKRRYQTVQELAEDVRRHLRHEPVVAGPPSALHRLRKFARRHRVPVVAATAVLLSLVLGLLGTWRYASLAHTNLQRFEILAIGSRLAQARDRAAKLYPPWPERLADFDRWIVEDRDPLQRDLARLRTELAELRARALPYGEADRERDEREHPATPEVRRHRERFAYTQTLLAHPWLQRAESETMRATLTADAQRQQAELPELERAQKQRRTWRFASGSQQFLHDTMTRLEDELKDFLEAENANATALAAQRDEIRAAIASQDQQTELWQRVAAEIERDPRHGRLRLVPQFGLVPLGRDPESGLHEFYHLRSGPIGHAIPERKPDGRLRLDVKSGIVFVLLPGGRAVIGAEREDPGKPGYDPEAATAESPAHEVALAPFFLGKHEVTQSQWWYLTTTLPSHYHKNLTGSDGERRFNDRHPVENMTWDEAARGLARQGLELPTESQWEYACRAGAADVAAAEAELGADGDPADGAAAASAHARVGRSAANAFGLHDMLGNVHEWCRDSFSSLAYLLPPRPGDGLHPVPDFKLRSARGAAFDDPPRVRKPTARWPITGYTRAPNLGLRAARRVQGLPEAGR